MKKSEFLSETITCRVSTRSKSTVFGIGNDIADLLGFSKGERVNFFVHRQDMLQVLIKKSTDGTGLKLWQSAGSRFMNISIAHSKLSPHKKFIVDQAIPVVFEFNDENILSINLANMSGGNA